MKVTYLPYRDIDKTKWDRCIHEANNRLIYGFSYFLDNMAANWDGLVLNDYEAVMPLTWKKKLLVKYLYQPAFMQQGGIFSKAAVTSEITNAFLQKAADYFRFAEIMLNYGNDVTDLNDDITHASRLNYIVQLDTYDKVFDSYDPSFTKSLRRIKKFNLKYKISDDFTTAINMYKDLYADRMRSLTSNDYENLISICHFLIKEKKVITRFAFSHDDKLLSSVVLLKDNNRLYNIISCITDEGKKLEANYFLYDKIIEEFSGQDLVLDLEGSEVKGIAAFYKKFNPSIQSYHFIKYNELNPILKVFKK